MALGMGQVVLTVFDQVPATEGQTAKRARPCSSVLEDDEDDGLGMGEEENWVEFDAT
jgi:hypothetical protein